MNAILEAAPALSAVMAAHASTEARPSRGVDHLQIFGRHVRVDVHEPPDHDIHHTILLLHGVGGLLGDGSLLRRVARNFALHHLRACVVHYFNTTGTFFATNANFREHCPQWQAAVVEITHNYAESLGEPVGLLGYSLGGALAVEAAKETSDVGAVAVLSGGLLEEEETVPAHLPPLLVLHGAEDSRVPVEKADALVKMGRRAGAVVESIVYPKEGHSLGSRAERDALERAAEFFEARLEAGANR